MPALKQFVWSLAIAALGALVGCASNSPTAPSSSVSSSSGSSAQPAGGTVAGASSNSEVEIEGVIAAIDAGAHTLTVSSTVVTVPDSAQIRRGEASIAFAGLLVGDRVEIHATRVGTAVNAVTIEDETEPPPAAGPGSTDPTGSDDNEDETHTSGAGGTSDHDTDANDDANDDDHGGGSATGGTSTTSGDSDNRSGDSSHDSGHDSKGGHGRD